MRRGMEAAELLERVRATVAAHDMMRPGDTVLVAVSGGPDSVCLLHALVELGYRVEAAHMDHGTRNGESAADAVFVREMTAALGVPCHMEARNVEQEATEVGASFEDYARGVRYAFLARTARARGCAVIATGHHADDQAETVLMRMLRGAGPGALAGIPPAREEEGVRIVRPLLDCTREEVLAFLDTRGLTYRTDHTNEDTAYFRNRVRHDLLPHLESKYNPRVREALTRFADLQRVESAFVDEAARAFHEECVDGGRIGREAFRAGHPALQRRLVARLAWRESVACPFLLVDGGARFIAEGATGKEFDLGGGLVLRNSRAVTEVRRGEAPVPGQIVVPLTVPGETHAFGRVFRTRFLDAPPSEPWDAYCTPARQVFDADALGPAPVLRFREPGDRFVPLGLGGTKKLKDYFIDLGLSADERERQVLLYGERGIAWVVGHAVGAYAAFTPDTKRLIELEVCDARE